MDISSLIEQEVNKKVAQKEKFTAHEITLAVRANTNEYVSHFVVKEKVKELYKNKKMSGYTTHLGNFATAVIQPIVYAPEEPTQKAADPNNDDDEEPCHKDRSSRLCIPNRFIKALGLEPGDRVYVCTCGNGLILTTTQCDNPGSIDLGSYVVDKSNNVRITNKCLKAISPGDEFGVKMGNGRVEVKQWTFDPQTWKNANVG